MSTGIVRIISKGFYRQWKMQWKYGKIYMEEACVLTNLTCTALAPSKISSTTFLEIESPISCSTLLTGESGETVCPMECIHSYWGSDASSVWIGYQENQVFGYYLLLYIHTHHYCSRGVCCSTFFGSCAPRGSYLSLAYSKEFAHALFIRSTLTIVILN